MDKYVLKTLLALVIIIMLCVYFFNACTLTEPAAWDYNVVKGKSYEAGFDAVASKDPAHVTNEVYFKVNDGDNLIVLERKYNYALVSKEINDEVVYGYIDAYYLSEDARSIVKIEPKLGTIENCDVYYTPSTAFEEKYPQKYSGVVKVTAKANGFVQIRLADFNQDINEQMWVREDDVEGYNALKIDLGKVRQEAKMYANEKLEERASETLRDKIYDSTYVKINADLDEYVKVINKDGDTVVIEKVDFIPLSDPSLVK